MRTVNPACQAEREKRGTLSERDLVWIEAKRRDTGERVGLGFWSGDYDESIVVPISRTAQQARLFIADQGLLRISKIRHGVGLIIRPFTVGLATDHPVIKNAMEAYDPQGAPIHVWRATLNPNTGAVIGAETVVRGFVNKAPSTRAAPGGSGSTEVEGVSRMRMATIKAELRKSHAAQELRNGDDFRLYKNSADTDTLWGMK